MGRLPNNKNLAEIRQRVPENTVFSLSVQTVFSMSLYCMDFFLSQQYSN
jgi:hypothetical protein